MDILERDNKGGFKKTDKPQEYDEGPGQLAPRPEKEDQEAICSGCEHYHSPRVPGDWCYMFKTMMTDCTQYYPEYPNKEEVSDAP